MTIEFTEDKKQSFFAYKNDELLFYSTIKFNWLRKNLVKIFNSNNDLILELQSYEPVFSSPKYKILFQNKQKTKDISEITELNLFFDINKKIRKTNENLFSFKTSFSYYSTTTKIADLKVKYWSSKMSLQINDENIEFLDPIIIHLLSTYTGHNYGVD
ncbi:hypothetical protein [Flavobacterium collinsii]|uniref:Uncharacterized protein n=1 Tax=Flavobacterium collinsii TaxID=1114861 RepID=A0ABM8KP19_9FLAO|nr:hypothetical protein [Flavobacterium collinsii]CAA9201987.1 hypothetical protein FLACOL7796_04041 [Flavobacterium collinsii]